MSPSRNFYRFIARLLIGGIVLAQVAVSAYACPVVPAGLTSVLATHADATAEAPAQRVDGMPGAPHLDPSQPNLCAAHCQAGQQNADGKPALTVPPALLASLYPIVPAALRAQPALTKVADLPPAASEPLAILHCCFRI